MSITISGCGAGIADGIAVAGRHSLADVVTTSWHDASILEYFYFDGPVVMGRDSHWSESVIFAGQAVSQRPRGPVQLFQLFV